MRFITERIKIMLYLYQYKKVEYQNLCSKFNKPSDRMSYILTKLEEKGLLERLPTRPLQIKISQKGVTNLKHDIEELKTMIPELTNENNEISTLPNEACKYLNKAKFIEMFIKYLRKQILNSLNPISQFITKEKLDELTENILESTSN
ncbi:MAG: hypothetical protein P8Y97_00350 [Candidatus Lokiarchaeota archaeon]